MHRTIWLGFWVVCACGPVSGELPGEAERVEPESEGEAGSFSLAVESPGEGGSGGWGDPGGQAGGAGAAGAAGSAGTPAESPSPEVPPPPEPSFSKATKSFCKKYEKICGFGKKRFDDELACCALHDNFGKKQKKCVEAALADAKSDPSDKNCRAAAGGGDCAP